MSAALDIVAASLVAAHGLASLAITGHILAWLHLLWLRQRAPKPAPPTPLTGDALPPLLLQLPLYNEAVVVEGLLRCVARLDWPELEVQVLDDSTDETSEIVARLLPELQAGGLKVSHVRRGHRQGFKAGALAHGLTLSDAPLVAILDADFRPAPGYLRAAAAWLLAEESLGLVQCRWAFLNADASLLTRAQALHLDAHFALEQVARSSGGLFMGFNGTAGVWRRACIEAAGGWEGDTLTEDLDLAYRAQLAGWPLRYVDAIAVPCELPEPMPAIRAQQHRWIRGGAQVARKLLRALWASEQPTRRKLQGSAHLLASSVFLPVLALCVLLPTLPALLSFGPAWVGVGLGVGGQLLRVVLVVMLMAFGTTCVVREGGLGRGLARMLRDFPPYMLLAMAICVHDARAAWMGWTGPTGTFVRTPKGGQSFAGRRLPETFAWELALALWSWAGVGMALAWGPPSILPFVGFQALAFTAWVALTLRPPRSAPSVEAAGGAPSEPAPGSARAR